RGRRQPAQVVVWVVLMMPFFLAIAGLMIDSGQLLDARREAQNLADAASRVAATQIDMQVLHQSGKVQLDQGKARQAALDCLRDHEHGSGWQPANVPRSATVASVTVSRRVPTTFLRIINVQSLATVSATGTAQPCA